jgi:hypothetical protein
MAKGVIVRIVAINVQQSSMDCTVHWQWSICGPSSRRRWLPLSNKESYKWWEINRPAFKSQRGLLVQPLLLKNEQDELSLKPINRHWERESCEWESASKDVRNIGESGLPMVTSSSCLCSTEKREIEWGWELLKRGWFLLLYCCKSCSLSI